MPLECVSLCHTMFWLLSMEFKMLRYLIFPVESMAASNGVRDNMETTKEGCLNNGSEMDFHECVWKAKITPTHIPKFTVG